MSIFVSLAVFLCSCSVVFVFICYCFPGCGFNSVVCFFLFAWFVLQFALICFECFGLFWCNDYLLLSFVCVYGEVCYDCMCCAARLTFLIVLIIVIYLVYICLWLRLKLLGYFALCLICLFAVLDYWLLFVVIACFLCCMFTSVFVVLLLFWLVVCFVLRFVVCILICSWVFSCLF